MYDPRAVGCIPLFIKPLESADGQSPRGPKILKKEVQDRTPFWGQHLGSVDGQIPLGPKFEKRGAKVAPPFWALLILGS
jgi:hypothetical protein